MTRNVNLNGNITRVSSNCVSQANSAILADRLDILYFSEMILEDIASGRQRILFYLTYLTSPRDDLRQGPVAPAFRQKFFPLRILMRYSSWAKQAHAALLKFSFEPMSSRPH